MKKLHMIPASFQAKETTRSLPTLLGKLVGEGKCWQKENKKESVEAPSSSHSDGHLDFISPITA